MHTRQHQKPELSKVAKFRSGLERLAQRLPLLCLHCQATTDTHPLTALAFSGTLHMISEQRQILSNAIWQQATTLSPIAVTRSA